jgi:outer membrane scaffolding protein for murein synthesis (MipA/OmpV family)
LWGDGPLEVQAGGIMIVTPKYEGSKDYEVLGVPFAAPVGAGEQGRIQFRGPEDIRLRLFEANGFEAGPLAGWRFDRDEDDARRLDGLGDIDGGVVAGGYIAYRTPWLMPFLAYSHQLSGDETGGLLRFGAEAPWIVPGVKLTAQAGATWADDDYMDAFFSVSAAQSAASGVLAVFDAEAGIKDVYFGLGADVPLTDTWTLKVSGRYAHLLGDAGDSPIVESESQFFGTLGLTYRFSLGQ